MSLKTKCACCGEEVDKFDICEACGWQDDGLQNDNPDYKGGANKKSLNEAKEIYKNGKAVE
ncbi:CPCC family cysteine-rich protein [Cellulosilyticum sp. ST5]|uniref:Cysteine-rich CPCC domain-containing protein n=1 Tax=Cellulosilyticum lentocellum (strain ATCC 49066 / DSM 5427 / NCIMB 11756 / RHM5) TaxID=642492 RepID=F2JK46_CELLD|nr:MULTISPECIES: CPCC family cysteine-rich protein [Cellulosilyticum]ADZ84461.1 hypothetical protein Clole_2762 [Cellulosilyticum lentocellum DSM 5427]QEH69926.1 hypothetical protein EKH84_16605 [Cellulosilyticum sp. WCF-2]